MIYDILPEGKENKVSTDDLMLIFGFSSTRSLRKQINKERRAGCMILSTRCCGGGYYKAASRSEIEEFNTMMERSGRSAFVTSKEARRYLKQTEGQTGIDFDGEENEV